MSNYWDKMKLNPSDMNKDDIERRREAYNLAHEIRKFEIGLFWQRATYYWAFILAAFTSHFALIGLLFNSNKDKKFSIPELYNLQVYPCLPWQSRLSFAISSHSVGF